MPLTIGSGARDTLQRLADVQIGDLMDLMLTVIRNLHPEARQLLMQKVQTTPGGNFGRLLQERSGKLFGPGGPDVVELGGGGAQAVTVGFTATDAWYYIVLNAGSQGRGAVQFQAFPFLNGTPRELWTQVYRPAVVPAIQRYLAHGIRSA